ncbi:helix-turn-helix transcriptional regulator [Chroococcus sp. FPU101]|uniref:helix-turn-helix domain-containing protein n=1 Tax=Chroococcus sp. FPU101 TaxID=1974212 RepID=UPI001A8D873C|nr:helix-turn-helix domain-containing protein [Chroococcus sp. FPU101]GFE72248.1 hypothetical protein CFPU101_48580 [Chroococcus sp. FPU101]
MSTTFFRTQMIRWRLRVLMAEQKINNKTLAEKTGIHPTTISRLKNTDELKQITGEILNALCNALECTPNDLIQFAPDHPPEGSQSLVNLKDHSKRKTKPLTVKDAMDDTQAVA